MFDPLETLWLFDLEEDDEIPIGPLCGLRGRRRCKRRSR